MRPAPSAELRWFVRGPLPRAVRAWFDGLEGADGGCEVRTDYYLPPGSPAEPGIKVRGAAEGEAAKVEVKRRTRRLGRRRPGPVVEGRAEAWEKWSYTAQDSGPEARPEAWIAVDKTRWLRKFEVVDGEARVPEEPFPPVGANVELSTLRVEGASWWSVCVEAFGPNAEAARNALRLVATHAFGEGGSDGPPPSLEAEASMGYPAWLHRLNVR